MCKALIAAAVCSLVVGCRETKPGTEVKVMEQNGEKVYLAGAAGPGINQGIACDTAVNRAVAAIALRFTQDNDGLDDEVAKEVGVTDGKVFLERFARARLQAAAVQNTTFDPAQHVCMATVRWTPPVFVTEAVKEYAVQLKADEQAANKPPSSNAAPAAAQPTSPTVTTSSAPAAGAPGMTPPPSPTVAPVAQTPAPSPPVAPAAATPPPPSCAKERDRLHKADDTLQAAQDELDECMRRTNNNTVTCTRYKLYVDQAQAKDDSAKAALDRCTSR